MRLFLLSRSTNVFRKPKDDGRVDCVGMVDGLLTIVDFKSSSRPKEEHMMNLGTYKCVHMQSWWKN